MVRDDGDLTPYVGQRTVNLTSSECYDVRIRLSNHVGTPRQCSPACQNRSHAAGSSK
jgi:hypothetical protein